MTGDERGATLAAEANELLFRWLELRRAVEVGSVALILYGVDIPALDELATDTRAHIQRSADYVYRTAIAQPSRERT